MKAVSSNDFEKTKRILSNSISKAPDNKLFLEPDLTFLQTMTTEKMMSDLYNVKKNSKNINDTNTNNMYCRDDTHGNTLKCCRENCIKCASYKNVITGEYVCWYHSYVK